MTSCIHALHDYRPYEKGSEKGKTVSIAKRAILGLILTGAIAAGLYYASMALQGAFNPFNLSVSAQMGFAIASASCWGFIGLVITSLLIYKASQEKADPHS